MRPFHVALLAIALLAGSAGYITQQWRARQAANAAMALDAPVEAVVATAAVTTAAADGDPARPLAWRFRAPDGAEHGLDEWAGKLLVVNFWATWCPPCLREIPAFVALQDKFAAQDVQFIGIALDEAEPTAAFARERGMNYPVLVGNDEVVRFMQLLGNSIGALPYTVVFAPDGSIAHTHQGEWALDAAESTLAGLLPTP